MAKVIKTEITNFYSLDGRGVYVIASETVLCFNGSEEIGGYVVSRHFSDFRRLHKKVGSRLGMTFDFSRRTSSTNVKNMKMRAIGLQQYLRLLLQHSFKHGGNKRYHQEILDFLDVDLTKARNRRSSMSRRSSLSNMSVDEIQSHPAPPIVVSSTTSAVFYFSAKLIIFFVRLMRYPFSLMDSWLYLVETSLSPSVPKPQHSSRPSIASSNSSFAFEEQTSSQKLLAKSPSTSITTLSPAATQAYNFLNPLVQNSGRAPLYVIPPGAVTKFTVEIPGAKPTISFELDSKYQRFINDIKPGLGPVTFDVTFSKKIRGTFDNGSLTNLEGVFAKRLPLTIQARVTKMILPKVGQDKVIFVGKAGFFSVSLGISTSHFTELEKWATTKVIE